MKQILLTLALIATISFTSVNAQDYIIDQSHSAVLMKVQRFGVVNVIGRFGEIDGKISYDAENAAATSADISVTVNSYSANNVGGEVSAKGPAFLDGDNHPNLTLVFKNVEASDDKLKVTADLTIKGVTKEVSFDASVVGPKLDLPTQKQSIALNGLIEIQRLDFGVGPDRTLPDGTEIIGNKVSIMMEFLAIAE